jgi:hypothetical protein
LYNCTYQKRQRGDEAITKQVEVAEQKEEEGTEEDVQERPGRSGEGSRLLTVAAGWPSNIFLRQEEER